jgi:DNA-binding ferritin-like protein
MDLNPQEQLLQNYIVNLRLLSLYTQHAHWATKGTGYYGDHLLFARLYEAINREMDGLAEKAIGVTNNDLVVCPVSITQKVSKKISGVGCIDRETTGRKLIETTLQLEKGFLSFLDKIYAELKENGGMTMGLDDFIMAMHNTHEGHVYLLQQRLKGDNQ